MRATIIHISDLHFHSYPQKFSEFNAKRILGATNLLIRRAREFPLKRAKLLVEIIQKMEWDHLVISGDITQLSLEKEFSLAREILDPLLIKSERVTVIPGNHDRYINQHDGTDLFTKYFGEFFGKNEIHVSEINQKWILVGWDSAHPNDLRTAAGTVKNITIQATEKLLQNFPDQTNFIVVNHYPLTFPEDWKFDRSHELYNLVPVRNWILQNPQIRLYLHGHIHLNWVHRLTRDSAPELLLVNSAASCSKLYNGQSSSFHQIVLEDSKVKVNPILLN
ncbi:MAG: metallophosphoesterase [SAR324 cluster bacterium]|nr:metallophosphoesterase [SAR324 cluster bacterium]